MTSSLPRNEKPGPPALLPHRNLPRPRPATPKGYAKALGIM
jgi:hypothetical protein